MKPADAHVNPAFAEWLREIEGVRELIRLHSDQHHHARARLFDHARQAFRPDPGVRLIKRMNLDRDIFPEDVALGAIACEAENGRERIGRNRGAKPLNHIPVIVVM